MYVIQGASQKRPPKINRNISSDNPLLHKNVGKIEDITHLFLNMTKVGSNFITTS